MNNIEKRYTMMPNAKRIEVAKKKSAAAFMTLGKQPSYNHSQSIKT